MTKCTYASLSRVDDAAQCVYDKNSNKFASFATIYGNFYVHLGKQYLNTREYMFDKTVQRLYSPIVENINKHWMAIQVNLYNNLKHDKNPHVVWDSIGTRLPLATGPTFGFIEGKDVPRMDTYDHPRVKEANNDNNKLAPCTESLPQSSATSTNDSQLMVPELL